jgi:hypothetical protein
MFIRKRTRTRFYGLCHADGGADGGAGGGADAAAGGGEIIQDGAKAVVDLTQGGSKTGDSAAAPDFKTQLGDLAKDPALSAFSDLQGIAKAYISTKALVGKAQGIPGENATPEEKAAFYNALGVPETPEGYGLKAPEGLPEAMAKVYDEGFVGEFAKTARDLNLTPAQAQGIQKWYDDKSATLMQGLKGDIDKSDAAFAAEMVKVFGTEEKGAAAQAQAQTLFEKYLTPDMRASLGEAPANVLASIAMIAQGLSKDMTGEDFTLDRPQTGAGKFTGLSEDQLREKGRELMRSEAFNNAFHKDHAQAKADSDEIYAQIGRMQAAQGKKKK